MRRPADANPRRLAVALLALCFAACSSADEQPWPEAGDLVVVKTRRLTRRWGLFLGQAHHTVIDFRLGGSRSWYRVAVDDPWSGARIYPITTREAHSRWFGTRPITVLALFSGERARRIIGQLPARVEEYGRRFDYGPWPGPNSNTFIDELGRKIPELQFEQHHNAFCKDFVPGLRAGSTTTGSGIEIETPILGAQVGFEDGIELHVMTLTLGANFWPPRLEIPFLPRLGW